MNDTIEYLNASGAARLADHLKLKKLSGILEGGASINDITPHEVSTLPYGFFRGNVLIYNGELHMLGSGESSYRTYHYKWNGSTWVSVSTLPYQFYQGGAVVYNNEIHIMGGGGSSTRASHYKWNGSTWVSVSTLPYNFYQCSAVVYNNEIHLLGSSVKPGVHIKYDGSSWTDVGYTPSSGFYYGSAVVYNNEIHILGGNGNNNYTKHYKWNGDGSSWSEVSTLPYSFTGNPAVVYNNEIHILGSYVSGNETKYYKWNGINWSEVSTLPCLFSEGRAIVYDNKIHILGAGNVTAGLTYHYTVYQFIPGGWTPITPSGSSDPTSYTQTADVSGLRASDIAFVQHDASQMSLANIEAMEKDKIRCIGQVAGELTFIAEKLPDFDIPLNVVVQGGPIS